MIVIFFVAVLVTIAQADEDLDVVREHGRIVGGTVCARCPWMASLQQKPPRKSTHFCGGVIIKPTWIMSAAHCFQNESVFSSDNPKILRVRVGSPNWDSGGKLYDAQKILSHPKYAFPANDIALVELFKELSFNEWIKPLSLPEKNSVLALGTPVTVSGWGTTNEAVTVFASHYQHVHVRISRCLDNVTKGLICAHDQRKSFSNGDGGGPLYTNDLRVVGIVIASFDYQSPGVYTDVAHHVEWIQKNTVEKKKPARPIPPTEPPPVQSTAYTCRPLLVCWLVTLFNFFWLRLI